MIDEKSFIQRNINEIIEVIKGDIVEEASKRKVTAIVNAAKSTLMGGSGVDGAIHKKMAEILKDKDSFNQKIKQQLDGEPSLPDNTIRCHQGEARITENNPQEGREDFVRYIIHAVGPKYDGGSECIQTLAKCYESIMQIVKENSDIKSLAVPIISSGNYGFPMKLAFQIALVSISNQLLEWKKHDSDTFQRIEKIYLVIYHEQSDVMNSILDVYRECETNMKAERRMVYMSGYQSQKAYCKEIWKYDSEKRYYFTITKMFRLFLAGIRMFFVPSMLVRSLAGKRGWKYRREVIEIETVIKMLIPFVWILLFSWQKMRPYINGNENRWYIIAGITTVYVMLDTITCLLALIFLADIHRPSANPLRTLILLVFNYLEMIFGMVLFYYLVCNIEKIKIGLWAAMDYSILGKTVEGQLMTMLFRITEYTRTGINFLFGALMIAFFVAHLKQRKFLSEDAADRG
ncbi:hypothetical protein G4443_15415 [Fusicatenibacter saccharivorans]|uniref:macro domain-containing protein n=1 Tax=Fusicatenibacter saccharivorans TaxID=1150298 RepID=UPI001570FBD3|nr:hypothetical protein [Fusicatenibacter saccharivorans]